MSTLIRYPLRSTRKGFTLIEIMVVIAIIVILAGILLAVGSGVIGSSKMKATKATLKSLDGMMKDYLAAGNPEPAIPSPWLYPATNPPIAYAKTRDLPSPITTRNPNSDPINWVIAFRSSPEFAKKLSNLRTGVDILPVGNITILDAWGTPIRYVPYNSNTKKEGYFQSAGPDLTFADEDLSQFTPTPPTPQPDDIFSTDP